jgi:hypothetical protein
MVKRLWLTIAMLTYFPLTLPASPIARQYNNWEQAEAELKKNGDRAASKSCYDLTTVEVEKEEDRSVTTIKIHWKCGNEHITWCSTNHELDIFRRNPEPTTSAPKTIVLCFSTQYFRGNDQYAYILTQYVNTLRLYH